MNVQAAFEGYVKFLENLKIEDVPDLRKFVSADVVFCDPFHDVKGLADMSKIFVQLFKKVSDINFNTESPAIKGATVYFNWKLNGKLAGKPWNIEGVTRLTFNEKKEIIEHREYWDAASQLYEKFPIIGLILRYFRHRISNQEV